MIEKGKRMSEKYICIKCKMPLSYDKFSKNKTKKQGINSICKKCDATEKKEYYKANRMLIIEKRRLYTQMNKDKIKIRSRKYYLKHKKEILKYDHLYYLANKEKIKCQNKTQYAIRTGKLIVGNCADCNATPKEKKIQAHHIDYTQPYLIVWLCASCHARRHKSLKIA